MEDQASFLACYCRIDMQLNVKIFLTLLTWHPFLLSLYRFLGLFLNPELQLSCLARLDLEISRGTSYWALCLRHLCKNVGFSRELKNKVQFIEVCCKEDLLRACLLCFMRQPSHYHTAALFMFMATVTSVACKSLNYRVPQNVLITSGSNDFFSSGTWRISNESLTLLPEGWNMEQPMRERPNPSINEKLRLGTIICLLTMTGMVTKGRPRRKACCVLCCVCRCVLRAVELPWNIPEAQKRISVVEEEMGKQKAARKEYERRAEVWDVQYVIQINIFQIFCMRNIRLSGVITSHNGNKMRRWMPEILDFEV